MLGKYLYIHDGFTYIMYIYYRIWQSIQGGKLLHLEWTMVIRWKIFAVAYLWTYIANRQGHNLWEKIHG